MIETTSTLGECVRVCVRDVFVIERRSGPVSGRTLAYHAGSPGSLPGLGENY